MKDLGKVKTYSGINIEYDKNFGKISLDQSDYIESLGESYNLENSKLFTTPMEQNLYVKPAQSESTEIKYRN